jgi:hypothetical protein
MRRLTNKLGWEMGKARTEVTEGFCRLVSPLRLAI